MSEEPEPCLEVASHSQGQQSRLRDDPFISPLHIQPSFLYVLQELLPCWCIDDGGNAHFWDSFTPLAALTLRSASGLLDPACHTRGNRPPEQPLCFCSTLRQAQASHAIGHFTGFD
ncbi:hypothetical protein CB1_000594002 [Camelus ferus]|nr:hypothetical protein CB1_000594002 [Camelus ferus]